MNHVFGFTRDVQALDQPYRRLRLIVRQDDVHQLQLVDIVEVGSLGHGLLRGLIHPVLNILNVHSLWQVLPIGITRNSCARVWKVKIMEGELCLLGEAVDEQRHVLGDLDAAFVRRGLFEHGRQSLVQSRGYASR